MRPYQCRSDVVGIFKNDGDVISHIARFLDRSSASGYRLDRVPVAKKPVENIDRVTIGFDHDVPVEVAPPLPFTNFVVECHGAFPRGLFAADGAFQKVGFSLVDLAEPARVDHFAGLLIRPAVALLEPERDVESGFGRVGGLHDPLAGRDIDAGGLLHVDVLAGSDGRLQMFGVQKHRRCDDDRVDFVAREHLIVVQVGFRVLDRDTLLGFFDLLLEEVAQRDEPRPRNLDQATRQTASTSAGAKEPDPNLGVRGASANRRKGNHRRCSHKIAPTDMCFSGFHR